MNDLLRTATPEIAKAVGYAGTLTSDLMGMVQRAEQSAFWMDGLFTLPASAREPLDEDTSPATQFLTRVLIYLKNEHHQNWQAVRTVYQARRLARYQQQRRDHLASLFGGCR